MANTDFIQATIELFGVVITLVVAAIFAIITGNKKKSEKDIFWIIIGSSITLLADAGWYIYDGNMSAIALVVNRVSNMAMFLCNPIMAFIVVRYVKNLVTESGDIPNKRMINVAYILAGITFLIPISNVFYKWMYYFDEHNIYHRMSGWYFYALINALGILLCVCIVYFHKKNISRGRRIAVYIFGLAPFIGIGIQSVYIGISFIQLGVAVGSIVVVLSYIAGWIKSVSEEKNVSSERKMVWLIGGVFIITVLAISSAIATFAILVNSVSNENSEQNSVALAYMAGETIGGALNGPVDVSRTMAQSEIIREALSLEELENTATEERMLAFMNRVRETYGYELVFAASEKTKSFYTYEGLSRYMKVNRDSQDAWYYEIKKSDSEFILNIDNDKDHDMRLSAFVNMKVIGDNGELIGVCGVGMTIESLMEILLEYEEKYDMEIFLTDYRGIVQVATDRDIIEKVTKDISDISLISTDVIYEREKDRAILKKNMGDFGWNLIVYDNEPEKVNVIKLILPSIIIYLIGIAIMLAVLAAFFIHERHRNNELAVSISETETAKAESAAKGRFLANMSHEIRTPINAVLGMDTMILRETNDPKIKEYAMNIQDAGFVLLSIISDILDISKIESGKMEIIPVDYDLSKLIHDVINMTSVKAEAKGLKLNLVIDEKLPAVLFGDDVRIRQIILNLMSNAVKYTESGSVTFSVSGEVTDDNVMLKFSVKDTGIGIKPEDINRLFEDYVRLDEVKNKNVEGTGLGISITIQLLELMNSKLNVTSVYGEGSEFYFNLEQKIIDRKEVGDVSKRIIRSAESYDYNAGFIAPDAKVLIVDDHDINRVVFKSLLKETLIQIDEAGNGKEALDKIVNNPYDIVFLDHMMPDMDGIEVLHRVKSINNHPNTGTPMVALTANAMSGVKEKYLAEGFDDYLAKPIIPEVLEELINTLLPVDKKKAGLKKASSLPSENGKNSMPELPMVEGIDWNVAKLHLPNEEMFINTLRSFEKSINLDADTLENLYNDFINDKADALDNYRIKVHAMKSASNLIGCFALSGLAATLEFAARDNKTDVVRDLTCHFLDSWRSYREKLSFIASEDGDKKDVLDKTQIVQYLEGLKSAIAAFDVHEADSLMEKLSEYKYEDEVSDIIERLSAATTKLEIENVQSLCDEMTAYFKE